MDGTTLNNSSVLIDCSNCSNLDCCIDRVQVVKYNNTADELCYPPWRSFAIQIKVGLIQYL